MTKPWTLWMLGNGAAVMLGLATGWFVVSIPGTMVACAATAVFLPWMSDYSKEAAHG